MSAHTTNLTPQEAGHGHAVHESGHEHGHSHGGPKVYLQILIALLTLTFVTVFVARHPFEDNTVNIAVALTIASIKATLVAMIFMHLKYDKKINAVIMISCFVFLGLLLGACLTDFTNRESVLPGAPVPGGPPSPEGRHPGAPAVGGAGAHSAPPEHMVGAPAGAPPVPSQSGQTAAPAQHH